MIDQDDITPFIEASSPVNVYPINEENIQNEVKDSMNIRELGFDSGNFEEKNKNQKDQCEDDNKLETKSKNQKDICETIDGNKLGIKTKNQKDQCEDDNKLETKNKNQKDICETIDDNKLGIKSKNQKDICVIVDDNKLEEKIQEDLMFEEEKIVRDNEEVYFNQIVSIPIESNENSEINLDKLNESLEKNNPKVSNVFSKKPSSNLYESSSFNNEISSDKVESNDISLLNNKIDIKEKDAKLEENKIENVVAPQIPKIEPKILPQKKLFSKYQPKVIPKKLQAKNSQNDDFFQELSNFK